MRFTTLSVLTTAAISVGNAAPVPANTDVQATNSGLLNNLVNSISALFESDEEPIETPGDHWKKFGKDQKKHWKKVGKSYKKKYASPADDDSSVESDDNDESDDDDDDELVLVDEVDEPVEAPGEHWKKFGKHQRKHWKKVGKQHKKKHGPPHPPGAHHPPPPPPPHCGDDEEEEAAEELAEGDEPVETPGEHWKKFGKDQRKHWKKVGKQYKKKYTPPADSDEEELEFDELALI